MRLLFWILLALAAIALGLFAASNREAATLALWPLPFALELPLYLALLAALAAGFFVGIFTAWITGGRVRRELRRSRRRINALEREMAATQRQLSVVPRP